MLERLLSLATIIIAILLMAAILVQQRGSGLGIAFGGEGNVYRTMRGAEKFIFIATVVLSVLFVSVTFLSFYFRA